MIDGNLNIVQRSRYKIWDLLADVGGFNDGLYMIFQLFMSSYSALSFKTSILNKMTFGRNIKKKRSIENSRSYK